MDHIKAELPRFARQITFVQGRCWDESTDITNATPVIHTPFPGVLNLNPRLRHERFLKLSYLALQPLVINELTETVRKVYNSYRQHTSKSYQTDTITEQTSINNIPSITRLPTARVVKRPDEERVVGKWTGGLPTRRQSPTMVTKTIKRTERTPSTALPASRRLTDNRKTENFAQRADHRASSKKSQIEKTGRRYAPLSDFTEPRQDKPTESTDNRWRNSPPVDVTGEVIRARESDDVNTQVVSFGEGHRPNPTRADNRTESKIREKVVELSEQRDLHVPLRTQLTNSRLQPSVEKTVTHHEQIQPLTSHTTMTVLGADGDEPVHNSEPDNRREHAPKMEIIPRFSRTTGDFQRHPQMTVRNDRARLESSERSGSETAHTNRQLNSTTSQKSQGNDKNDNIEGLDILSLASIDNQPMESSRSIDRLVDRLYTKFERKFRIEQERRGH